MQYSVTGLIDLLNKPALIIWANKIGLEGINVKEYRKSKQKSGNTIHFDIENFYKNGVRSKNSDIITKILKDYKFIGSEVAVKTDHLSARIDLIMEKENAIYVFDIKSTSRVYLQTKLQLSAYKEMYKADKIGVINLESESVEILNIDTKKYYIIIKRLYQIKTLLKNLNERL